MKSLSRVEVLSNTCKAVIPEDGHVWKFCRLLRPFPTLYRYFLKDGHGLCPGMWFSAEWIYLPRRLKWV